jgi:ADP-heptose:LPS heptosyltransferase
MRRVVVLRALGLGDLLTAVPALRALRRACAGDHITLCAPGWLRPLAELTGAVDEVADTGPLEPLDPRLAGADLAVNLHGSGPQSHRLLAELEPGRLIAFRNAEVGWSSRGPAWDEDEHEVNRWCRLLDEERMPAEPSDLRLRAGRVAHEPLLTVVHPGAASGARRWPAERFAEVVRREREAGRRVLVTGGEAERDLGLRVAGMAGLPEGCVTAGETGLPQLIRIVGGAGRVVCGDTGPAHLATALGTPSVVLFGPTSPEHWGPPADDVRHIVLWHGSTGDPHAARPDPGLLEIGVDEVLAALDRLDEKRVPGTVSSPERPA